MDSAGFATQVNVEGRKNLPHYRRLVVSWKNGAHLTIGLDQGLGYWAPKRNLRFPFTSQSAEQWQQLLRADVTIAARDRFPTVVYLYPVKKSSLVKP